MPTRSLLRSVFANLVLAGLFFLTGQLGLSLVFSSQHVTPIWPASGLALAAIWLWGPTLLPGVLLGGFFTTLSTGMPPIVALLAGTGNLLVAYVGFLILKGKHFDRSLAQIGDVLLLLVVAVVTPVVSATIGVFAFWANNHIRTGELGSNWLTWWVGDVVGIYLVAPFLFAWSTREFHYPTWRWLEFLVWVGGMIVACRLVFFESVNLVFVIFPLVIWGALRFLQPGATLATVILAITVIAASAIGEGPFGATAMPERLFLLQSFLAVAATTAYLLAAGASERSRSESIKLRNATLEAARQEAEAGQKRLAFLAEVSSVLSQSLEYETTLGNIVRLAVPRLADHATAAVVNADGQLRYVTTYHPQPLQNKQLRAKHNELQQLDAEHPIIQAVRTNSVVLTQQFSGEPNGGPKEEHLIVPLGTLDGSGLVVCLTLRESGRHYSAADKALAAEVQMRAHIAVENARLYQGAQEAINLRNEFLSVAAHELKTPVTGLLGFAQLARRQIAVANPDHAKVSQALSIVEQQSKKLSLLIEQLLDGARIQSGKLDLARQWVDLRALIENSVTQMRPELGNRIIDLQGPAVSSMVDPLRIEQVIVNLLTNATKFSPPESQIDIAIANGDAVTVSVRDYGPGIPLNEQPHVFDRFFQGVLAQAQGMGLGLYISRQIAELHGGSLVADTPQDGKGSRFVLTLPHLKEPAT